MRAAARGISWAAFLGWVGAAALGCESSGPSTALKAAFPERAAAILAGDGFALAGSTFVPRPRAGAADPVAAAERALAARQALSLSLPVDATAAVHFSGPGFDFEVREMLAQGSRSQVERSVAASRRDGSTFWTTVEGGFEQWLLLDAFRGPLAAEWEVRGGSLRQRANGADVVDPQGRVRVVVSAPAAYSEGGAPAHAWLQVDGNRLRLFTDAHGPHALVDPVWTSVASMGSARQAHTATLLTNGKVLVTGAQASPSFLATAEVYDPTTGTWAPTANAMSVARGYHTATLLPTGMVLVAGGLNSNLATAPGLTSADLYNPSTNAFTATGSLTAGRSSHTATLLSNGQVLVTGGSDGTGQLSSAELYDPASGTWSSTAGPLVAAHSFHCAAALNNGTVLVMGGLSNGVPVTSAELYNPVAKTFSATGPMVAPRMNFTAVALPSGKVLAAGGLNVSFTYQALADLYDPVAGTWTAAAPMIAARYYHSATLLPSGKVMVAGGGGSTGLVTTTELFDPVAGGWTASAPLAVATDLHTATLLPSGQVLVAGGNGSSAVQLLDPASGTWGQPGTLQGKRQKHTATLLQNGKVLLAGGFDGTLYLGSAEIYDPATNTFAATASLADPRANHTATLLNTGKVLVAGGFNGSAITGCELYDPHSGTWSQAASLTGARYSHTASLLLDGRVLAAAGTTGAINLDTAEIFDPTANTWTATGTITFGRYQHTQTTLPSGLILVAGGVANGVGQTSEAELFSPSTNTWSITGSMTAIRAGHTASLLPNGRVLVTGGYAATTVESSAEVFDPAVGTWAGAGGMTVGRSFHSATVLAGGKVLIAAGEAPTADATSAELYDSNTGVFTATASLAVGREYHSATLLPSGQVLVTGGENAALQSSEVFDDGRGAQAAWTPTLSSAGVNLPLGVVVPVAGTLLTGVSEASLGAANASPTNYPLVQLMREDNEQELWISSAKWTATSTTVTAPLTAASGFYWMRAVVNGVSSAGVPVLVGDAGPPAPDAGPSDAGPSDAGLADGGSTGPGDAGFIDAGIGDAGGLPDGGPSAPRGYQVGCDCQAGSSTAALWALIAAAVLFGRADGRRRRHPRQPVIVDRRE